MTGYRPSARARTFKAPFKFEKNRKAWCRITLGEFVYYRYDEPPKIDPQDVEEGVQASDIVESGPTIRIGINRAKARRPIYLDLTNCTEIELAYLKEIFDLAIAAAEPVVKLRDKEAQDAAAIGDDSYSRVYRQVPQLVIRPREERADAQSLRNGPEDIPTGDESDLGSSGLIRATGDELAERKAPHSLTEDNESSS